MGALVDKVFQKDQFSNFTPDFDKAAVPKEHEEFYKEVEGLLKKASEMEQAVVDYESVQESIRKAMQNSNPKKEKAAFEDVLGNVKTIKKFHEFSKEICDVFPKISSKLEPKEDDEKDA